jgi:hypothetical protein
MGTVDELQQPVVVAPDDMSDREGEIEGPSVPPLFTDEEREWVLDSVIASQALEGLHISREAAARLLDKVMRRPLPKIG